MHVAGRPVPEIPSRQSTVAINLKDLFAFLTQYEEDWPDTVVICPWGGIPLPSMEVRSDKLNGKLQFSVDMMLAMIRFQNGIMPLQRENT